MIASSILLSDVLVLVIYNVFYYLVNPSAVMTAFNWENMLLMGATVVGVALVADVVLGEALVPAIALCVMGNLLFHVEVQLANFGVIGVGLGLLNNIYAGFYSAGAYNFWGWVVCGFIAITSVISTLLITAGGS